MTGIAAAVRVTRSAARWRPGAAVAEAGQRRTRVRQGRANVYRERKRSQDAAANFVTLKHMAHNLARRATGKMSIRARRKAAAWDDEYLVSLAAA